MSDATNTQTVKDAYAAFLRGDVPAILNMLDDNVQWHGVIGTEGVMKSAGLRKGRAAVGVFFNDVASTTHFDRFEPREYVSQGDTVVAMGHYVGKSIETGRSFDLNWVMVFRFANGRIVAFQEFTDSAALVRAFGKTVAA